MAYLGTDAGGPLVVRVARSEEALHGRAVFREANGYSHEYFQLQFCKERSVYSRYRDHK